MLTKLVQFFYPDIQKDEVKKFSLLALAFVFTVGTYWIMRLLKDVVLYKIAFPTSLGWSSDTGRLWIPTVKTLSPLFVLFLVLIYNKLVDLLKKHTLIYVIASFYIVVFSVMTGILLLKNTYGDAFLGKNILAASGILGYLFTESFGSLMIALFWSFTVSSCTADQAKRTFPFIIAVGQLGAIIGSSLFLINTNILWPFYAIVVLCLGLLVTTIKYLVKTVPDSDMTTDVSDKKKPSNLFSGFTLLITQPYLIGVLIVSTFYDISGIIVEYQMDSQASIMFDDKTFTWFKGIYGISINTLAFFMALLGTNYIIKRFGTQISLLIYPSLFALALLALYGYYLHTPSPLALLWATFGVMLVVKATLYAINNPVREMMYIPTSKDVRFKTKSIIDMVGLRSAKMTGAQIGGSLNVLNNPIASIHNLMLYGSLISLGIIGVWVAAAIYVGAKNKQLVDSGKIIE
ncbi:MAG: hypothetical protein CL947_00705 [Epsilonproteobacteria bacterium]|nr:hypothetical protein [Campylobacterota bacterium]